MCEWKEYKLSEVIEILGGGTPKTRIEEYWNGSIPWLSVVDFGSGHKYVSSTEKYITELGLRNSSTKVLKKGDIILSARGTVGEVAMLTKDMAFNQSCYGIKAIESITDNHFVYYLLKQKVSELQSKSHGAVFDTITRDTFKIIDVKLPNLATQKAIAEILTSLDDKIEINNKINQELEHLAQTIFKQWFVDFEFPDENGKPYKSSGGKMIESELGLIPDGWEVKRLENFVKVGSSKRIFRQEYVDNGIPFFRGKEITELDKSNKVSTQLYITYDKYDEIKEKYGVPKIGDILVTSVGTIGNTYLINSDLQFYFKDGNITWIKDYTSYLSPFFIFTWLRSNGIQNEIKKHCIGSTQQALTITALKNLKILDSSEELILSFTRIVEPIYKMIFLNKNENQELEYTKTTLLPKLMKGEIEVPIGMD